MANCKEIHIQATVPFDWASELTGDEAQVFAAWLLNPVVELHLDQRDLGYVPNDHGGRTSTWSLNITGFEAISWPALDVMLGALRRVGTVDADEAYDVDAGLPR